MDANAILELFEPAVRVALRRMFGGHGIYADGLMFAIEADGVIWVKADALSAAAFDARGLKPFTYVKNGKPYEMSYRELPASAFDDADELRDWVRLAREAALRSAAVKMAKARR
jgi:DNA transformation protein and related proteins